MINSKPSELCGACKLYDEKCHCLCHKQNIARGFHEIITEHYFKKSNMFQKIVNKLLENNRI